MKSIICCHYLPKEQYIPIQSSIKSPIKTRIYYCKPRTLPWMYHFKLLNCWYTIQ